MIHRWDLLADPVCDFEDERFLGHVRRQTDFLAGFNAAFDGATRVADFACAPGFVLFAAVEEVARRAGPSVGLSRSDSYEQS